MHHNDELIGQVTLFIYNYECFADRPYIKRSCWGTSASDQLGWSMLHFAANKGCQTVSSIVANNNQSSSTLHEHFRSTAQYQVKRMKLIPS
jgi:hypothetical protein